ncbi:phage portal protein [Mycobacterium sp. TY814]|uniref:phage portal protein n=1 Tax=unclassified Mycobacterium TaxID=2642494 RepID=UPI0027421057|nr:phage portal protein [Mycobacterium sp. TY814]MDP7725089.1 phage portal protein [Mycobacterium sp. TY814]
MTSDILAELLAELDSRQGMYAELERYATGTQPLTLLTAEQRKALDNRLCRMAINIPALAVSSLVERLRVSGFSDPRAWKLFLDAELDQLAPDAMTDALTYGIGFVLCWTRAGRPVASVESPREVAVLRDPADRTVVAAVKRYSTKDTTEAYVYLPDRVEHWRAPTTGSAVSGFVAVDTIEHNLGVVPMVPVDNGRSEIEDLRSIVDSLTKVTLDMVLASHAAGFGRRWVSGITLAEKPRLDDQGNPVLDGDGEPVIDTVSPFDEQATIPWAIAEQPETKFGSFDEPTLGGFETVVRVLTSKIMAISALPSHYLGVLAAQPTSADALRASEASLTARAESKQLRFGRAFEQVGRLLIALDTGLLPESIPLRVHWSDAATRSAAQEADAAVKLHAAGIISRATTLRRLGMTDDEIAAEMAQIDAEGNPTNPPRNVPQNRSEAEK